MISQLPESSHDGFLNKLRTMGVFSDEKTGGSLPQDEVLNGCVWKFSDDIYSMLLSEERKINFLPSDVFMKSLEKVEAEFKYCLFK